MIVRRMDVWLGGALVLLAILVAVGLHKSFSDSDQINALALHTNHNQRQNTAALCALRKDETERIAAAKRFLVQHPHGIPGIRPSLIATNINSQQRTVNALSVVVCP